MSVNTGQLRWDVADYIYDAVSERFGELPDDLVEWITEHIEKPVLALICERDGHVVIDDQCMRPDHRYCAVCMVAMPNEEVTP